MANIEFPGYVDYVYEIVKKDSAEIDSVYEDYIVGLVGSKGLEVLLENKLLESCGVLYGRQLYTLLEKKES